MAEPDPEVVPQSVLSPLTTAAIFLVVTIDPGGEPVTRELLAGLAGLQRSVGFRVPEGRLSCVVGIGSQAWDRLFGGPRPAELHPFRELAGAEHRAVSTPGDLLFHIRATQLYPCFELASQIMNQLGATVTVRDEVYGFTYFDQRDLLGFVDGTENPVGPAANAAVLIGAEDPEFAGGSYVIVQKYLHDLRAWNVLPVEAQEKVIGRTKLSNIELDDAVKPSNSHVALTTITDPDGTQRQILRDNMAFGTVGRGEFGTYFIGYARRASVTEKMLENMFFGDPPGNHDRILDFSTPVTGTLFFAPAASFFDDLPDPPGTDTAAVTPSNLRSRSIRGEGIINRRSPFSVAATVAHLSKAIEEAGAVLFAVVDHSGEAQRAGLSLRETRLLIFGNPSAGTPVMQASPLAALDLPLKLLVWADDTDAVWMSYLAAEWLADRHHLPADLTAPLTAPDTLANRIASSG